MSGPLLEELAGPPRSLSLIESGRVLGGLRWVELEAFRTLGQLAAEVKAPQGGSELAVWASGSSLAHAWRAEQLESLLPVSAGLTGAEECTASPGSTVTDWVVSLVPAVCDGDIYSPGGVQNWYTVLAGAYELRAAHPHPSADGAVIRSLRRLAADVRLVAREYRPLAGVGGGDT